MPIGATEYTELIASTMENHEVDPVDQVIRKHPTLSLLADNYQSISGRELVINLEGGEDSSTQQTDESGTFNTGVSGEVLGAAVFPWGKPIVSSFRVKWADLQKNSSKEAVVDLVKTHLKAAEKGHRKFIAQQLHAIAAVAPNTTAGRTDTAGNAYTARGPLTDQFNSLDMIVANGAYEDDPNGVVAGTVGAFTVGGISGTAKAYWNAKRIELPKDHATMGAGKIRKAIRHVRNELVVTNGDTDEDNQVTHVVCGRNIFEELEDSFDDKVRYVEFGEGQTRFRALYDGDIEIRLDPDCPPDRAYFLNVPSLRLRVLNGNWMQVQKAQPIQGTLDWTQPIASILTVGTAERRANAVLLRPSTAGGAA